jgi:hypothetical protein
VTIKIPFLNVIFVHAFLIVNVNEKMEKERNAAYFSFISERA